jgi:hypothetical protein
LQANWEATWTSGEALEARGEAAEAGEEVRKDRGGRGAEQQGGRRHTKGRREDPELGGNEEMAMVTPRHGVSLRPPAKHTCQ